MTNEFFTWAVLLTYAGATLATSLVTQLIKGVGFIDKIPTRLTSYVIALVVLIAATFFTGGLTLVSIHAPHEGERLSAQRYLGHANAKITLEIYSHLSAQKEKYSAEQLQGAFEKSCRKVASPTAHGSSGN